MAAGDLMVVNAPYQCFMIWSVNSLCNLHCEYCFGRGRRLRGQVAKREDARVVKYTPEEVCRRFEDTGKVWRVLLIGGEPFLYPHFVELCRLLTKKHYIDVVTNLSTKNVYEFADTVPPDKTVVSVSCHVAERMKRTNGLEEMIDKYLYLQGRGFKIWLQYCLFPPLVPEAMRHMELFKSRGVRVFYFRPFIGMFGGKSYPESYTDAEKAIMNTSPFDVREVELEGAHPLNPYRQLCTAGQISFVMDVAGNLVRCFSSRRTYGNFLEGRYHFDSRPRPCVSRKCQCPLIHENFIQGQLGGLCSVVVESGHEAVCKLEYIARNITTAAVRAKVRDLLP